MSNVLDQSFLNELFDAIDQNESTEYILTPAPFPLGKWLKNQNEMNHPCSLCGSTNWPDPESLCPLCDGPLEPGPDPDDDRDHDSHDETTYQENL
jgi:hypothetical protein